MAILFENNNGLGVVTITDPLTAVNVVVFRNQFVAWFQTEPDLKDVVIDFGGVRFMDSSGLGAVIGMLKHISGRGGALTLARPQRNVKQVFEITGADQMMTICDTLEEAMAR
jgi:anti-anti-sigma factor